jgi:hypothetical protein
MTDDFIGIYDHALTPEQCVHILQRFEASGKLVRGRTGNGVDVAKKDSWDLTITQHPEWQDVAGLMAAAVRRHLAQYVDALVGAMYRCGPINLQKYLRGSGGYHHWHSEIYPQNASCETLHRVLLFQFYLNDVVDGGETEFLYQGRKVEAREGRLIIAPAGFTHTHKGHVAQSGDKYVATSWILYRRAEELFGQR